MRYTQGEIEAPVRYSEATTRSGDAAEDLALGRRAHALARKHGYRLPVGPALARSRGRTWVSARDLAAETAGQAAATSRAVSAPCNT